MGRPLDRRLHVTGTLTTDTALHVGAADSDGIAADLLVARDGAGRLIVPGTSLAGALRQASHLAAQSDDQLSHAWHRMWGAGEFALVESREARRGAGASLLLVSDAVAAEDATIGATIAVRDHVGIDRLLGAAAHRTKYDRLVVAPGTDLTVRITLEIPPREPADRPLERLLAAMLALLEEGRLMLGGATTRGLGRVRLRDAVVREECLADREGILAALAARRAAAATSDGRPPRLDALEAWTAPDPTTVPAATRHATIALRWAPERSLVVSSGRSGDSVDVVPLTVPVGNGESTFVLPGSAIKGALRSAAERVLRTIEQAAPAELVTADHPHHRQIDVPLVRELFGAPKRHRVEHAGGRGALSVADCHATVRFSTEAWRRALLAASAHDAEQQLRRIDGLEHVAVVSHNSLDRWTGGAADKRLFGVLEPRGVEWEEIALEIDIARLEQARVGPRLAGALLWLVLNQACAGELAFGGSATRGHGIVEIDEITVTGGEPLGLAEGSHAGTPEIDEHARSAWTAWIAAPAGTQAGRAA